MIQISMTAQEFMEEYNLKKKAQNRYIFEGATQRMYGIPQAVRIEHDALVQHLEPYVYLP